jgi:hypothetical protein
MPNDNDQTPPESAPDQIANLKAEMNRKLDNTNAQFQQTNNQLQALLAQMQASAKPAPAPTKKVSVFDDEEAFTSRLRAEAAAEAETRINASMARNQELQVKQAQRINALVQEFPELSDSSHSFTKRAVEIFDAMPEDERQSSLAYRAAVKEAALEMGVKPRSKRSADELDAFVSPSGRASDSGRSKKKAGLSDGVMLAAELLGLDIKNPEVKKRLESSAERENWTKFQSPSNVKR